MTPDQVNLLAHGVYRVWWVDYDDLYPYSLASVGSCEDGSRWIAPCNWTGQAQKHVRSDGSTFHTMPTAAPTGDVWERIERVELIEAWTPDVDKAGAISWTPEADTGRGGVMPPPLDAIEQQLSDQFDHWDIWRTMDGQVCVKVVSAGRGKTAKAPGIVEAMTAAAQITFLPVVPPRPYDAPFRVERVEAGNKRAEWAVTQGGLGDRWVKKTKREAEELVERANGRLLEIIAEWDAGYGWSRDKVEGADYERPGRG